MFDDYHMSWRSPLVATLFMVVAGLLAYDITSMVS